jgi:hypothetical protein
MKSAKVELSERNDLGAVRRGKAHIDHVGDPPPRGDAHDLTLERAQRHRLRLLLAAVERCDFDGRSSGSPRRTAALNTLNHGPTLSPMASTLLRHTLM